jgi:hypothetical protein
MEYYVINASGWGKIIDDYSGQDFGIYLITNDIYSQDGGPKYYLCKAGDSETFFLVKES